MSNMSEMELSAVDTAALLVAVQAIMKAVIEEGRLDRSKIERAAVAGLRSEKIVPVNETLPACPDAVAVELKDRAAMLVPLMLESP